MQANETLPLDFQRNQAIAANNMLSGNEDSDSKLGFFDGVASSELQPDSDVMTQYQVESSTEEESDQDQDADELSNFHPNSTAHAHRLNMQ